MVDSAWIWVLLIQLNGVDVARERIDGHQNQCMDRAVELVTKIRADNPLAHIYYTCKMYKRN